MSAVQQAKMSVTNPAVNAHASNLPLTGPGSSHYRQAGSVASDLGESDLTGRLSTALRAIENSLVIPRDRFRNLMEDNSSKLLAVGGHRGMGENLWNDNEPLMLPCLWRENTVKSFTKAEQHGATFVEFDVQVTKDSVPVVWHDDTITFGSAAAPITCSIRELTLQEFKCLGPRATDGIGTLRELIPLQRQFRSKKTGQPSAGIDLWHCFDDDQLPSLADVFQSVPKNMGLNLEVKMTTPADVERTPSKEVNFVVNAILNTIDSCASLDAPHAGPLVLSSFDPEVCAALKERQQELPVFFLTTGGSQLHADRRRMSVEAAIDLALEERLNGIVVDTSVLKLHQELVGVATMQGLKVMTYGLGNDDPEWILAQSELGVHAAVVDDVAGVLPQLVKAM